MTVNPDVKTLEELFAVAFDNDWQTSLELSPSSEPLYVPAAEAHDQKNHIYYAHGYAASALHEISHWCLAGRSRLDQRDYGYWYNPDRTSESEQEEFENVEARPQALEWIFSSAMRKPFYVSLDQVYLKDRDINPFREKIRYHALKFMNEGLPERAADFLSVLFINYQSQEYFSFYWERVASGRELPH